LIHSLLLLLLLLSNVLFYYVLFFFLYDETLYSIYWTNKVIIN